MGSGRESDFSAQRWCEGEPGPSQAVGESRARGRGRSQGKQHPPLPLRDPRAPLFTSGHWTPETKGKGGRDLLRETPPAGNALLKDRLVTPHQRREQLPSRAARAPSQVPRHLRASWGSILASAATGEARQSARWASSSASLHLLFFGRNRGETL